LDEENPTYAGLAHENGFHLRIIAHIAMAGKRQSSAVDLQKRV
jgi:hypothetical protein